MIAKCKNDECLEEELEKLEKLFSDEGFKRHNWWITTGSYINAFMTLEQKKKEYIKWLKNNNSNKLLKFS